MERRKVSVVGLFTRHFLWVPLIPALSAAIFLTFSTIQLRTSSLLERHGITVSGEITRRDTRQSRNSNGQTTTYYYLTYTFRTEAGEDRSRRESVSQSLYNQFQPGARVDVTYAETDASVATIAPGSGRFLGVALAVAGVGAVAVTLGLGQFMLRRKLSLLRAAWHGEMREAQVTAVNPGTLSVNGRLQYRMEWRDAAANTGQSAHRDFSDLPEPGAVIVVYVDPVTGRGWWEEDL